MAAQTGIVWINERDVATDFAFAVTGLSGWPGGLGAAPRSNPLLGGPEMHGAILDPRLMTRQPGRASLSGIILGTSTATALAYLDALKQLCGEGEVAVRTAYATERYVLAILDQHDGVAYMPSALNGLVSVTLTFSVKDGCAFRVTPDGLGLSTARTSCPIGTVVSAPVITIHGGGAVFTNPTITVRNAAGDSVQTMGMTFSGGADDALIIDSARARISKSASGTITDGASYWTSGDFCLLRPCDGWVESEAYPSIELSSATGTAQGSVVYVRRYA